MTDWEANLIILDSEHEDCQVAFLAGQFVSVEECGPGTGMSWVWLRDRSGGPIKVKHTLDEVLQRLVPTGG